MSELPNGTVTILFTDVAGSTALLKRHRDVYRELLQAQERLLRDAFRSYGGREIDTQGDAFFVAFGRAGDAVVAVSDAQRALAAHPWPEGANVRVRMGLHTTEPEVGDKRYFGLGVHLAARICSAAHGGQVLLSNATRELIEGELPRGVSVRDLGEHPLKDIGPAERLYQLDVDGLQTEFPPPMTGTASSDRPEPPRSRALSESSDGLASVAQPAAEALLEREDALTSLRSALQSAEAGEGRLVFVAGEAGVGKSSLVRALCADLGPRVRLLTGGCDPLFTPRPLGPLADVAAQTGGGLSDLVDSGAPPHLILRALVDTLDVGRTVLVLEDVHWADEASLDVLRLLGRRVADLPVLLIATYREDEIDTTHPLRLVLGDLVRLHTTSRVRVDPLSEKAVAVLAAPTGIDPTGLYHSTGGNPFFVTEVLATPGEAIPATVRDAVLARSAGLSEGGRKLLEAVAVVRPSADIWLLEALEDDISDLDECLELGMLRPTGTGVAFRHELARLAVETSLRPDRLLALHRRALVALAHPPSGPLDVERLAHHADAAGDGHAVLEYAPGAAARAAAAGAHREAASQYERALRFADGLRPDERARLLRLWSHECYLTDQPEAITALEEAIDCFRKVGDARREGATIRALSNILWCPGRVPEAYARAQEALDVLEALPPSRELAWAYATTASHRKDADETAAAIEWGTRALELAEEVGEAEAYVHALNTIGTAEAYAGIPGGVEKLERSLACALEQHSPIRPREVTSIWPSSPFDDAGTSWPIDIWTQASSSPQSMGSICGACTSLRHARRSSSTADSGTTQASRRRTSSTSGVSPSSRESSRSSSSPLSARAGVIPERWISSMKRRCSRSRQGSSCGSDPLPQRARKSAGSRASPTSWTRQLPHVSSSRSIAASFGRGTSFPTGAGRPASRTLPRGTETRRSRSRPRASGVRHSTRGPLSGARTRQPWLWPKPTTTQTFVTRWRAHRSSARDRWPRSSPDSFGNAALATSVAARAQRPGRIPPS